MKKIKHPFFWAIFTLAITIALMFLAAVMFKLMAIKAGIILTIISLFLIILVIIFFLPPMIRNVVKSPEFDINFKIKPLGYLFMTLVILIALAGINTGNNLLYLIFSFLISAIIASGLISRNSLYKLNVKIENQSRIFARKGGNVICTIENEKKFLPSFSIILSIKMENNTLKRYDNKTFKKEVLGYYPYIPPKKKIIDPGKINFPRRGIYFPEEVLITTSFPFGFFKKGKKTKPQGKIVVYPEIIPEESIKISGFFKEFERELNRKGMGDDLYALRKYIPGEDTRHIHWKSSAKTGKLIVKDFAEIKSEERIIAIDNYIISDIDRKKWEIFERFISLIASIYIFSNKNIKFFSPGKGMINEGEELPFLSEISIKELKSVEEHPIFKEFPDESIIPEKTILFTFLPNYFYKNTPFKNVKILNLEELKWNP